MMIRKSASLFSIIGFFSICFAITSCKQNIDILETPEYLQKGYIDLSSIENELIIDYQGLEILIDSSASWNYAQVSSIKFADKYLTYPDFKNKDYSPSFAYWVRLKVKSRTQVGRVWLAEFYDQSIDSIDVYLEKELGRVELNSFGDAYQYQNREFLHKNFHLIIPNNEEVQTLYIRIRSSKFADIRIALRSLNRFVYYALNEYFLYGIFYGMILIICLYNILMFFAIWERKYLYYTFYLLCVGVYAMCMDGISYQYLWPSYPRWNELAAPVFLYLLIIAAIAFSRKFLRTKTKLPFHDKVLKGFIVFRTLYFIIAMWEGQVLLDIRSIEVLPLGFVFYTSIVSFQRGYRPARFFIIAYGILFLGFIFKGLIYLNVIPFTIVTYYSLHIAFLFEMLFLTFSLADRVKILKNNRDRAYKRIIRQLEENAKLREKVNKELEEKVKLRTAEIDEKNRLLEESNLKLTLQSKEINQINSLLDLDNWKLKNNLKEVLKDKVFPKRIDFEEFKTIFPNDLACMKYLAKLKWEEGYQCRKCKHGSFCDGSKPQSKRCTKCGYDESVSSHTIFQGVKIPLNKAFYILYSFMNREEKLTLDQLSEMLELRRNTVWHFRKKIQTAIKNEGGSPEFSARNWQIIMIDLGDKLGHAKS